MDARRSFLSADGPFAGQVKVEFLHPKKGGHKGLGFPKAMQANMESGAQEVQ